MLLASARFNGRVAQGRDDLDRGPPLLDAKSATGRDFLVTAGMQVGKPLREFQLISIDADRAKSRLIIRAPFRQILAINRKEPANPRALQFEVAGCTLLRAQVQHAALHRAKNVRKHVKEMNANVRRDTARLSLIALPGDLIPRPAGRDVG